MNPLPDRSHCLVNGMSVVLHCFQDGKDEFAKYIALFFTFATTIGLQNALRTGVYSCFERCEPLRSKEIEY